MRVENPIEVLGMTTEQKINEVLDAFNMGVVTQTELNWLIPMIIQQGDKLTWRRLLQLIVGEENYEHIENVQ